MKKNYKKILAIDLGGTSAKCAYLSNGKILLEFNVKTILGNVIGNLYHECKIKLDEINEDIARLDVIGMAVPGLVDSKNKIVKYATNLNWNEFDIEKEIVNFFGDVKFILLNDGKVATYGTWKEEFNCQTPSMLLITLGTGIGGGVIFNNKLVFGDNTGLASEPGHGGGLQDIRQCACGLVGCAEVVASGSGMEWVINEFAKKNNGKLHDLWSQQHIISLKDISPLLEIDDEQTLKCLNVSMDVLAKLIGIFIHTFDFAEIVIAGGPTYLGEKLLNILKINVKKYILPQFYEKINIIFSRSKGAAGLNSLISYVENELESDS